MPLCESCDHLLVGQNYKKGGTQSFSIVSSLTIYFAESHYEIHRDNDNKELYRGLYLKQLNDDKINELANAFVGQVITRMESERLIYL